MFPTILVGAILPVALSIGLNIFLLTRMTKFRLLPLFAITIGFLLVIYIIIPFFTQFKKIEDESKEKNHQKKG